MSGSLGTGARRRVRTDAAMTCGPLHEVTDLGIRQGVDHLPAASLTDDDSAGAQHPEVLRYQRLRHRESVDQLVDTVVALGEQHNDSDPNR